MSATLTLNLSAPLAAGTYTFTENGGASTLGSGSHAMVIGAGTCSGPSLAFNSTGSDVLSIRCKTGVAGANGSAMLTDNAFSFYINGSQSNVPNLWNNTANTNTAPSGAAAVTDVSYQRVDISSAGAQFYTSTDGVNWTATGGLVGNAAMNDAGGGTFIQTAKMYWIEMFKNGTQIAGVDFTNATPGATSIAEMVSGSWTRAGGAAIQ